MSNLFNLQIYWKLRMFVKMTKTSGASSGNYLCIFIFIHCNSNTSQWKPFSHLRAELPFTRIALSYRIQSYFSYIYSMLVLFFIKYDLNTRVQLDPIISRIKVWAQFVEVFPLSWNSLQSCFNIQFSISWNQRHSIHRSLSNSYG